MITGGIAVNTYESLSREEMADISGGIQIHVNTESLTALNIEGIGIWRDTEGRAVWGTLP